MAVAMHGTICVGNLLNILGQLDHESSMIDIKIKYPELVHFRSDLNQTASKITALIAGRQNLEARIFESKAMFEIQNIQASKLMLAFQYLGLSLSDLAGWYSKLDENVLISKEDSKNVYEKIKSRLQKSNEWANEVFKECDNCWPHFRVMGFDIRLFCITMEHWPCPEKWIKEWKLLFSLLFADRHLKLEIFHLIRPLTGVFNSSRVQDMISGGEYMREIIMAMANICLKAVLAGSVDMKSVKNLFQYIHTHKQLHGFGEKMANIFSVDTPFAITSPYIIRSNPSEALLDWDFGRVYRSLSDSNMKILDDEEWLSGRLSRLGIPRWYNGISYSITPYKEKLIINLNSAQFLTPTRSGMIWAIQHGHIVSIDHRNPDHVKLIDQNHDWQCLTGAFDQGRVYAKAKNQQYVSIFDLTTETVTDRLDLPDGAGSDFVFISTENGIIFGFDHTERLEITYIGSGWHYFDAYQDETRETFLSSTVYAVNSICAIRISMLNSSNIRIINLHHPPDTPRPQLSNCRFYTDHQGNATMKYNNIDSNLVRSDNGNHRFFAWRLVTNHGCKERKRLGIGQFRLNVDSCRGCYVVIIEEFYDGKNGQGIRKYDRALCAVDEDKIFVSFDLS